MKGAASTSPPADAGYRNMQLLIQLRWLAVGGQLITIQVVYGLMGVELQFVPLLGAVLCLAVANAVSQFLLRRRRTVSNLELTVALLVDVVALAWQLHHSGGLSNPFASLFLLQVVIGAVMLSTASSWTIVVAAFASLAASSIDADPFVLPQPYDTDPMSLYLRGSLICFVLIAVLLVAFVTRINRNLRDRDAMLASVRQRAAEEDHIVRMGLLASGAAHELGTPLSLLSVLIGDWRKMPRLAADAEFQEDIADMEAAVQRCKAIVSGILISAGEARGERPEVTTMRAFMDGIVEEWDRNRLLGTLAYDDRIGEDFPIVSDPVLRQVIGNVIDNAAEASASWVGLVAERNDDGLVIEVSDRGPGFSEEMLASFGRPYNSTKGKAGGGLGLFLLVNVIRKLGGEAVAENREEGGARVRLVLPVESLLYGAAVKS